jgi:hypothetical protein
MSDSAAERTITGKQGSLIGLAFGFAAACSALIVAGTPWLFSNAVDQATFMVFWSVLFTFSGVLTGLSLEVTRAVGQSEPQHTLVGGAAENDLLKAPSQRAGTPIVVIAAICGIVLAAAVAATSPLWAARQFATDAVPLAMVVGLGVLLSATYHGTVGALAGKKSWSTYSFLIAADSGLRLVLVIGAALITGSLIFTAGAAGLAFGVWALFWLVSPNAKLAKSVRVNEPISAILPRFSAAAVATGSSALLVIGYPALLSMTSSAEVIGAAAPLLLALTLTRAPLMIPLNAVQGIIIAHFSRNRSQGIKALWPICRIALLVGALAIAGAWLVGPWLLETIWGSEFLVAGPVLGGLTAGATALAVLTLTGAVSQASNLHKTFVAGWIAAVTIAVLTLLVPLQIEHRAIIGLIVGPLCGIVVHLVGLSRRNEQKQS